MTVPGPPGFAWSPEPATAAATNVGRFMVAHGAADLGELRARAVSDPDWFWDAVVGFLGLPFATPYTAVADRSRGPEWTTWFVGGRTNLAAMTVDRWATATPDAAAVVWEGEDGAVRRWSWSDLAAHVDAVATRLAAAGIGPGDAVGLLMPMVPEAVAALLAVVKLGAVFLPLFSGYGADAVATRLNDAGARALVTADGFLRRGRPVDLAAVADRAAAACPSVGVVLMYPRLGERGDWPDPPPQPVPTRAVDSEHTAFIAYTSGTTGRPKGSVHVHAGFGVKVAEEVAFQFDCRPDDTLFWFTDLGWIMGPWTVIGGLANGATVALYEGAPDHPGPDRLWSFLESHRVTICGISPTLVRALMPAGDAPVTAHDLSSLRVLGSTGEPWNEGPWRWYFEVVGGGRCPVINISGGTEVGACFLSPHPVEPIKPTSLGGPCLGLDVEVYGDDGRPVRGAVGELVCRNAWPGMTRGLYRDPDRYHATYWSRWPGVWLHGDWASVDADGQWYLHGRSDDTIKVAGKRLGPAEVESVLVSHPAVVEAAAVGLPDEVKGETLWAYVVLAGERPPDEALRAELVALVADALGASFRPAGVRFVDALPKTRNAKVLRRAVRAVATGSDPGDLSSLEDPSAVDAVRSAR